MNFFFFSNASKMISRYRFCKQNDGITFISGRIFAVSNDVNFSLVLRGRNEYSSMRVLMSEDVNWISKIVE